MPAGKRYILKSLEFDCFHMLFDTETAAVELYDSGDPSILFRKIPYEEYMTQAE